VVGQTLHYGALRIPYTVFFVPGKSRTLAIHVHPDGSVQVDAPPETPLAEVKRAVSRRARWLCAHIEQAKKRCLHLLAREYVSGESHFYLGRRYVLKVRESRHDDASVRLWQGQLQVVTPRREAYTVRVLLWGWYRNRARDVFEGRLSALCNELPWVKESPPWRLLAMKKQWGSCSPGGVLSLNPHLVKAPARCIDYVLLHEVCHLKYHDHSPRFYRLLTKRMPDWEAVKARLDDMAELLLNA
jgi:predicted metal-dependent hydrolase